MLTHLSGARLTALDLIQRDFVSLSEEAHSFPVADKLSELLIQLYGAGAAALALLSEQIRHREQLGTSCEASQQILKVCVCLHAVPVAAACSVINAWLHHQWFSCCFHVSCCMTLCHCACSWLQSPEWHDGKKRLLGLLEGTLAYYYLRLQQASPEAPVTVPSAHWVRQSSTLYVTHAWHDTLAAYLTEYSIQSPRHFPFAM